ncbi:phage tail tape measure protein [Bacillus sp. BGMRC 2118]|nr:phage tail tape measure protein [Bacillus sp. BGMRC 2118]
MAKNDEVKVTVKVFNQDFNKGMQEMKNESSKLKREFQLQEEQMKNTGTETEKLQAKVEYLAKQHQLASRKVDETREQYEKIKTQFGENSKAADDMLKKLNYAQIEESKLANQLYDTNKAMDQQGKRAEELGDKLSNAADKMGSAGQNLTAGITLPILGVGVAALTSAGEVEAATNRIQASLGLTEKGAENLGEVAHQLWLNGFGEDMNEASEAVATVFKNMRTVGVDELEEITNYAFTLADAFGAEIPESTKTANQLIQTFGIDAKTAFDLMTTGFQNGLDFSGEFLSTLNEYASQFSALGFSAQEMYGVLQAGAESGAFNLDKVGDAVKEFNIRIKDGSKATSDSMGSLSKDTQKLWQDFLQGKATGAETMQAIIGELSSMDDKVKAGQIGVGLFGTQWEDLEADVVAAMDTSNYHVEEFTGATKEASDQLQDNFGTRIRKSLRGLQDALQPIGEILLDIVESALPKIQKMSEAFSNLSPMVQKVILVIAGIAAAIGPLLMIIGMLISSITTIVGALAPLIASITQAGGVMALLTNPITLVIAAVLALIAIFVALYKNNEDFRNKVNEIWAQIQANFQIALAFIMGIVQTVMTAVMAFFSSVLSDIRSFWDENGAQIISLVQNYFGMVWSYIEMVMGVIKGIFQAVWPIITGGVQVAWALIKVSIQNAIDIILGVIQFFLKIFKGDWKGAFDTIKETAKKIMDNIISTFKNIDLVQIGKDIINGLINGIDSMKGAVKKMVSKLADSIPQWAKDVLGIHSPSRVMIEVGEDTGEGAIVGLERKVAEAKRIAAEFAQSFIPETSVTSKSNYSNSVSLGKDQVESIQNAFSSALNHLNYQIKGDVFIEGRRAGEVLAPYVRDTNDFNDQRLGVFRR